jgi:glycine hydroxymethyltransferase
MQQQSADVYDKLVSLLRTHGAAFRSVDHAPEGRSDAISAIRGNKPAQGAKAMVVMVKTGRKDRRYYLAVVPGDRRVEFDSLKALCNGTQAMFAPQEMVERLTQCVSGAVPPFSFDDKLSLVVDPALLEHEEIVFNAGRLDKSIFLDRESYIKVARPEVARIACGASPARSRTVTEVEYSEALAQPGEVEEAGGMPAAMDGAPPREPEPASPQADVAQRISEMFRELGGLFALDYRYRESSLSLTASENYPSVLVRMLGSGLQGGFYHFDPPFDAPADEWHFPDSGAMGTFAKKLRALGMSLFEAQTFDWRPNGGSAAELAVMLGTCSRGDAIVHFAHGDGGHFALEDLANKIGIQVFHLPIVQRTLLIDVDRLKQMLRDYPHIKLVILDQSFKLRWQPLLDIREALPPGVLLSYDCSHDGGLIAGNVLPQPLLQGADVVHGNTHKTIPGPQKAFISFADAEHPLLAPISTWLCPRLQSNSHAQQIVPMLIALTEMAMFGREYAQQTTRNAKVLAAALAEEGFFVSGEHFGHTETHQVHLVLGSPTKALRSVTEVLPHAGFRVNNVEIPGTGGSFGLRLGTQAMTRRGMREAEFKEIARLLAKVLLKREEPAQVRNEVEALLSDFPLFPLRYSFDELVGQDVGERLLREALK